MEVWKTEDPCVNFEKRDVSGLARGYNTQKEFRKTSYENSFQILFIKW